MTAKINIEDLKRFINATTKPIDGPLIPNVTYPPHMVGKQRSTQVEETIQLSIRKLFNSLTTDNFDLIKEELLKIIKNRIKNGQDIQNIAEEFVENFIISETNIPNFMKLLNCVYNVAVCTGVNDTTGEKIHSKTIGAYFISKCRERIITASSLSIVNSLAKLDQDDMDQLDTYNREREKIINLIITLCELYGQRMQNLIRLTATHLYPFINSIIDKHNNIILEMKELGNPLEEDCKDEDQYQLLSLSADLYAEQLYTFISRKGSDFLKDTTVINGVNMGHLVKRFREEVEPNISVNYLVQKCKLMKL